MFHQKNLLQSNAYYRRNPAREENPLFEEACSSAIVALAANSTAFTVAAIQAGHTPIHHDNRRGIALAAQLGTGRKLTVRKRILLLSSRFELRTFLGNQLALMLIQSRGFHQSDRNQMLLHDMTQLGDNRRHKFTARQPVSAARIEYRLQFFDEKCDIPALAEDRRDNSRQRDDPLIVIEVFGVDENLEWAALLVLEPLIEHDVVNRYVHCMISHRRLDLVGRSN